MEIKGVIKVIEATQQVSDKFSKREFVVSTTDQYPQHILIQATQDKCAMLNAYKVGDEVSVSINLRGREWQSPQGETKYFNTIECWKISKANQVATPTAGKAEDDLPF